MTTTQKDYKAAFYASLNIENLIDNLNDEQRAQAKEYLGIKKDCDKIERMDNLITKSSYELYKVESLIHGVISLLHESEGQQPAVEVIGKAATVAEFAGAHIAKIGESFDAVI